MIWKVYFFCSKLLNYVFVATVIAVNHGADFVKHLVLARWTRQNKTLDPIA